MTIALPRNSIPPPHMYREIEEDNHDQHPLLSIVKNNPEGEGDLNNNPASSRQPEAAAIQAIALSSEPWVTPELRERNKEAFASYTAEKERECARQAAHRIEETKMQTLKDAFVSCKHLSRETSTPAAPASTFTGNIEISRSIPSNLPQSGSSSSYSINSHVQSTLTSILADLRAKLARLTEILDERVFTGKQAILLILLSVFSPLVIIGLIHFVGFGVLVLSGILGWALYGLIRCCRNVAAQQSSQPGMPLHLKQYGLMNPTKLQSMVHTQVELAFPDDPYQDGEADGVTDQV
mgnify:CR=1 FL=1